MSKLTSPSITIVFQELGASLIERSERGIVALALKDTKQQTFTVRDITDIPTDSLSADNIQYIKDALKGYTRSPKRILVYVMETAEDMADAYTAMLKYFATQKFTYLAIPTVLTDGKEEDVVTWIKGQRDNKDKKFKAVLTSEKADCEGVIAWATPLIRTVKTTAVDGTVTTTTETVTTEKGTARIAGLLAGTGNDVSATYAPLNDFSDVAERLEQDEMDTAVGAGKLIAFWDGEKVKLNRAVNSFTTTTATKQDSYKKIKLVEEMDLIHDDIKQTIEDSYIGKYNNTYDNKMLLVTAINAYFAELTAEGVINGGSCEINLDQQKIYLKGLQKDIVLEDGTVVPLESASDENFLHGNTGSKVFLKANVSLLDAIEDVYLPISV